MFVMRAALIQVTWMGYPYSTGLSTMDHLIIDDFGEVVSLKPMARSQLVFGSFNNWTKMNDATLSLWVKVMQAVPNVTLKLKTPSSTDVKCRNKFKQCFENSGIDASCLIFTGSSYLHDMMREHIKVVLLWIRCLIPVERQPLRRYGWGFLCLL